jgi:hypothetical protein
VGREIMIICIGKEKESEDVEDKDSKNCEGDLNKILEWARKTNEQSELNGKPE